MSTTHAIPGSRPARPGPPHEGPAGNGGVTGPDPVARALAELAAGRLVVVAGVVPGTDDGRGAPVPMGVVAAAAHATPDLLAAVVRRTGDLPVVAVGDETRRRLNLVPAGSGEALAPVRARSGAGEWADTVRLLGSPTAAAADLVTPGRVLLVRAAAGGVLASDGLEEAAVDLVRLAGLGEAAVLARMVESSDVVESRSNGWPGTVVRIEDLVAHRRRTEQHVRLGARARMPLAQGEFYALGYANDVTGDELVALTHGVVADPRAVVRVHRECLLGDLVGSACDCRGRMHTDLAEIAAAGHGVLVYVRSAARQGLGCSRAELTPTERADVDDVLAMLGRAGAPPVVRAG